MTRCKSMFQVPMATLICLVLAATLASARPQSEQPEVLEGEGFTHQKITMPLSDGVKLAADLFLPDAEGPFPTVFLMTPYGTQQHLDLGVSLAQRGYATLLQNVRGKGGSEGRFLPFIDEIPDHLQSLEWILAQPWAEGRVGLVGTSQQSYTAQHLASTGHPAVKTLINMSGLTDIQELFLPGGAFRLNTMFPWLQFFYLEKPIRSMEEWNKRFEMVPLADAFQWAPEIFERMLQGSVDTDGINVPVLHITGWNDVVYRQSIHLYQQLAARGIEQRLIVGPWMHNHIGSGETTFGDEDYGPGSAMTREAQLAMIGEWFDQYLNGKASEKAPVRVFMMGENVWRQFDSWPPSTAETRTLYLAAASEAALGPAAMRQGGQLLAAAGLGNDTTSFVYDPNHPVPTFGGVNSHLFPKEAGPRDQSRFTERDDVLVFTTPPLELPLSLTGPQRAVLYVSSSAPDTDFTVKLIQLRSDGYARIIEDGILRTRYRESREEPSLMEPGTVYRLEIELGSTALAIPAGDQLQIHVSSSNFPKYDRNPNTGEHPWKAAQLVPAQQTIHHSSAHPSHLLLTTLP